MSTVGFELERIKKYIAEQEETDKERDEKVLATNATAVFETAHNR